MRVGSVGYATDQGLAHLMRDFYSAGVVQEVMIYQHPGGRPTHAEWYPPGTPVLGKRVFVGPQVDAFLDKINILLCYETPFDWTLVNRCRNRGIKTVLMPMYEWFPERPPALFDLYLCPSALDYDIFSKLCPGRAVHLPVPVDPATWRLRTRARRYLHNAGHVGSRNHKGTEEVLRALPLVKSPVVLTVRCQEERLLDRLVAVVPGIQNDDRLHLTYGSVPYEDLFRGNDVYVAPEKYNGLSLPLQEARAAGMQLITTDRYPANSWLPRSGMVRPAEVRRTRVAGGYLEIDECVVDPRELARVMDELYDTDITYYSESGRRWAEVNSWVNLKPRYLEVLEELTR